MAEQLFFSRDSKLYIEFDSKLWEIPVLDGFSFSQSTNQSEISLSEMQGSDGLSRRGNRVFTDSLAPAEWSFSTYVRPFLDSNSEHRAVEEALWAVMAGADSYSDESVSGSLKLGAGANAFTNATGGDTASDRTNGTYTVNNRTAGIDGTGPNGTGITGNAGTGTGVGWEIDVTVSGGAVTATNVISGGSNFDDGETIILTSALLGGTGNVTLTIKSGGTEDRNTNFYRDIDADTNSPFGPAVAVPSATNQAINFSQSNRAVLGTCNLYFVMETSTTNPMVYKLESAAFNEASIDFEVDGIATINWSGFAKQVKDLQSDGKVKITTNKTGTLETTGFGGAGQPAAQAALATGDIMLDNSDGFKMGIKTASSATAADFAKDEAVNNTNTFIRNRLTQLLVSDNSGDTTAFPSGSYNLTLTGGNITISNNISYLVPEELGSVNVPIEHVTGGRTVNGNFTCYLTLDTATGNNSTSVELFNDMTTTGGGLDKVVNDFNVTFQIGGAVANTPRLNVLIPKCHIDVPTHSVEDVISLETNFAAYTTDFNVANEVQLEYFGV